MYPCPSSLEDYMMTIFFRCLENSVLEKSLATYWSPLSQQSNCSECCFNQFDSHVCGPKRWRLQKQDKFVSWLSRSLRNIIPVQQYHESIAKAFYRSNRPRKTPEVKLLKVRSYVSWNNAILVPSVHLSAKNDPQQQFANFTKICPKNNLQIQNDNLQNCEIMIRSNTLQILQKNIQQDNWLLHKQSQTINWHKNLPILIWNDNLQTLPKGAGTPICKIWSGMTIPIL